MNRLVLIFALIIAISTSVIGKEKKIKYKKFISTSIGKEDGNYGVLDHNDNLGGYTMPTSLVVDKYENVYVLDTPNFRYYKYNSNGKLLKSFSYKDEEEKYLCIDMAVDNKLNIYLSSPSHKMVLVFNKKGKLTNKVDLNGKVELPHRIFVDGDGFIYIEDIKSEKSVKVDIDGNVLNDYSEHLALAANRNGNLFEYKYVQNYTGNPDIKKIKKNVLKMELIAGPKRNRFSADRIYKTIKNRSKKMFLNYYVIGFDDRDNIYFFNVLGLTELPDKAIVSIYEGNGKLFKHNPVIENPGFNATRFMAVTPSGKVLAMVDTEDGIQIVKYSW